MAVSAFGPDVDRLVKEHALAEFPRECVGCVLPGNRYMRLVNESSSPDAEFKLSTIPDETLALLHSHPGESPSPSAADMSQQQSMELPWGIVATDGNEVSEVAWFGDQLEPEPYLGRVFLSGVRDCWGLVRDWYRKEHGVILDNLCRDEDWFKGGVDLLNPITFQHAGFRLLDGVKDLRIGDVVLGKIGSRVTNHCCLYIGRGLVLHHMAMRQSAIEPLNPWLKYCQYYVRHKTSDSWQANAKHWLSLGIQ